MGYPVVQVEVPEVEVQMLEGLEQQGKAMLAALLLAHMVGVQVVEAGVAR
jgi:hypothetical protein